MTHPLLKIIFNGHPQQVRVGKRIEELCHDPKAHAGPFPPLGALVNNRPVGLSFELRSNATVQTIDLSSREGMDIYRRTASTILYAALLDIAPKAFISVGQSIASGYFFDLDGVTIDAAFAKKLSQHMDGMIKANIPLVIERTSADDAIVRLTEHGAEDQVKLIDQQRSAEVVLVQLGHYLGLVHGPIAHRTGVIDRFVLYPYEHGVVLDFPDDRGELLPAIAPQPKLFGTYLETKRWNKLVKVETVADLNEHCMQTDVSDLVKVTEALHEKKIAAIADAIAEEPEIKLILIAGPSSSGKTTFAKRLAIHLKIHGITPVGISIDNYYLPRVEAPRHPDGSIDLESPLGLDIPLLNEQLALLLKGKEVDTPVFSFELGRRDPTKVRKMKLLSGQILIIEGIHGLNEEFSKSISPSAKFKIYVSALTQLCIDRHNRIFTTDTRLCRRIIRDRLYRGSSAAETIALWPSVRAGEWKYIFPFQEDADVIFNSALIYEHALLKPFAERFLMEVPREHPSFTEAMRLARFFSYFIPILPDEVPRTSIIREFIGGSTFQYG